MARRTHRTDAFFEHARQVMPFGVTSNFRWWGEGDDIAVARGEGAYIWDLDGNRYIDYRLGFGPVILGHGHPAVVGRVSEAIKRGTIFAFTHELEVKVADRIVQMCPGMGNAAAIMPQPGWLEHIRSLCDEYGIAMIMDEVKTGFRIAPGGAQEFFGVIPDLVTYAKAMANGFPIAVIGGKREIMGSVGPGRTAHGGTYCGNVVGTAAADVTLGIIAQGDALKTIEARGQVLMEGISRVLTDAGVAHHVLGVPAMFSIALCEEEPTDYRAWSDSDNDLYERITMALVHNGAVPDPDSREPWFLCAAHSEQDVEDTLNYDGQFYRVGPFTGLKTVDFPGPIGEQEVCYIPHPETRTMPKSLGAKAISVRGCFPPHVMRLTKAMLESGLYSEESVTVKGVQTTPFEIISELLLELPESKQTPLWAYGLVVEVCGKRDGREVKIKLWNRHPPQEEWGGPAAYYKNIAIPLSIGAQMIARGDVKVKGVVPPETAIDPRTFFAELRRRGIEIHERVEEYHVVA